MTLKQPAKISLKTKFALTLTIILWASAFVGIRTSLQGYSPGALALFRFAIASVCLYIFLLYLPIRNHITARDKVSLLLIGAITLGSYHLALNYAELTISAGIASFIISQSPVLTTLFAIIFLHERINLLGFIGMTISVFGVVLILFSHPEEINFAVGSFYALMAALFGSIYSVLQKTYLKKYHAIEVTAYVVWGATIPLFFYFFPLLQEIPGAPMNTTLSVIYLGVFPAALAYLAWSYALIEIPASRAANFLYAMPLLSTFLGWLFLGEIPALLALVGGLVALIGVWILNKSYKKLASPVLIEEQALAKNNLVKS